MLCLSVAKGGGGKGGGKAKVGKAGPIFADFKVPVEKDPQRLVDYVCGSNIYVDGEDVKVNTVNAMSPLIQSSY